MLKNKEKIRLIHIVPSLDTGGMENGVINLCNNHDRNRFVLTVCCLRSFGKMSNRLKSDVSIELINQPEGKAPLSPLRLATYYRKKAPDIVHTHGFAAGSYAGILGAKLAGVPVIINGEHGSFHLKRHQVFLQRVLSRLTDVNLSVSESLKEKTVRNLKISPEKITVIRNGVDTAIFSGNYPKDPLQKDIARKHGIIIDDSSFVLGNVGSLKSEKNQTMILKALRRLNEKKPDNREKVRLILVGDGPDRAALESQISKNDLEKQVAFLGIRDDIPQVISIMDVMILSSIHEGLSNVLLEAMSSGVPVITTNSTGSSEVVSEGKTGFIVEAGDVDTLSERIEILQNDSALKNKMSFNAKDLARAKFSIKNMVDNYETIYKMTLEKKNRKL